MFINRTVYLITFLSILVVSSCKKKPLVSLGPFGDCSILFAHRVNTIDELKEALKNYAGVELDIFFDDRNHQFIVKHLEEEQSSLTLKEYLKVTKNNPELLFWLDYKNPSYETINQSMELLNDLGIKEKAIIETYDSRRLSDLADEGFYTSYWVSSLGSSVEDSENVVREIKNVLQKHQFNALSGSENMFEIFNENFPGYYHNYWTANGVNEKQSVEELKKSNQTRVILVDNRKLY